MNNKKNEKTTLIIFGTILLVFGIFMVMHTTTLVYYDATLDTFSAFFQAFDHMLQKPFDIHFTDKTISGILFFFFMYAIGMFYIYIDTVRHRHYKSDAVSGTARFEDDIKSYNKKYTEPFDSPNNDGENNMILTRDISLSMDSRKTLRNNNILVVGGSGSGKSRFFVKPNILQANCNYVVTDPAGELLATTGGFLQRQGYEVKVFNLVEMAKSDQYNPFHYIRDDLGVLMMINCLIKNTNPDGKSGGDPFWEKSETALLQALCFYLIKYRPEKNRNFTSVMKMLRAAEIDENDASRKSNLDRLFDEVALKDPNSIALKQYLTFKMGAGKTLKSILISCSVRLTVFNMKQIENLTRKDTIDLGSMGEGKKALFVIIPAADDTYNFLVSMMYSQLFETLYFIAETKCEHQRLPRQVRFLLDEFANIGQIPGFTKKLATMRKYGISCSVILQNLAQIKTMYKDDWESIVGNCDSFLFLGGQEYSTLEYISKGLGKTTITVKNRTMSKGKGSSASASFNQTARDLMSPDEIMKMPKDECILIINGLAPFKGKKYDYLAHPNYKYTGDADDKYLYVNERDNSAGFDFAKSEQEIEMRTSALSAKRNIVEKVTEAVSSNPIPISKAFAGLTFNGVDTMEGMHDGIPRKNTTQVITQVDLKRVSPVKNHNSSVEPSLNNRKNDEENERRSGNGMDSVVPQVRSAENLDMVDTPKKDKGKITENIDNNDGNNDDVYDYPTA